MRGKDNSTNNSKKPADWSIVINKSPNKSKEVVYHGDRTNESLPPTVVSKAIEEDDNVHQSNDFNGSKPPDFIEVTATASISKRTEVPKLVTKRRVSL